MLTYMAGIPKVMAYCRENPYGLLTDWIPDKEPYSTIKHQVRRDLDLVKSIGATPTDENLCLQVDDSLWPRTISKLTLAGIKIDKPWVILHVGVSELKRQYSNKKWIEMAERLIAEMDCQVVLTGSLPEKALTDRLQLAIGESSYSIAGLLDLNELICLVKNTPVLISVNTGIVHIAAAVSTPVVVLYAQTNPQHTPWKVPCKVLQFPVNEDMQSKNEVIRHVNGTLYKDVIEIPEPETIVRAVKELLTPTGLSSLQFPGAQNENQEIAAS
jgi:ADP-heptose:LPS heptosyltransferase